MADPDSLTAETATATLPDPDLAPARPSQAGRRLSGRQERFIWSYLKNPVASRAVREAGYRCNSPATACNQGWRLMRSAEVRTRIEAGQRVLAMGAVASRTELLEMLTSIVRGELLPGSLRRRPRTRERLRAIHMLSKALGELPPTQATRKAAPTSSVAWMPARAPGVVTWAISGAADRAMAAP